MSKDEKFFIKELKDLNNDNIEDYISGVKYKDKQLFLLTAAEHKNEIMREDKVGDHFISYLNDIGIYNLFLDKAKEAAELKLKVKELESKLKNISVCLSDGH